MNELDYRQEAKLAKGAGSSTPEAIGEEAGLATSTSKATAKNCFKDKGSKRSKPKGSKMEQD